MVHMCGFRCVMRRFVLLVAIVAVSALPLRAAVADPFEINVIVPLTGGGAFLGRSEQIAFGVAAEVLNKEGGIEGRPVHFAVQDDQTTPQVGVQLLNGLLAKNVPIVMGSTLSAICGAMAPLVKSGPVMWCFSSGYRASADGWVFISGAPSMALHQGAMHYARQRGWHRIALIASTDASGQDSEKAIDDVLALRENANLTVVDREHLNVSDISVSAQMAHIKASDAQMFFVQTSGTAFGTILRGVSDAGIEIPVMSISSNETFAQMKAYASFLPKELYFESVASAAPETLPNGPVKRAVAFYRDAFKTRGIQPDTGTNQAWDAAFIIVGAFRKLGTNATPAQLRSYLDTLRGFAGTNGLYDFPAYPKHGVGANWTGIQKWDPGKGVFVGVSKPGGEPL